MNAYQRLLQDLGEIWELHPHDFEQFVTRAVREVKKQEPIKFARSAVRSAMRVMRRATSKHTKEQIAEKLFKGANKLFLARGEMRGTQDILQDAHDDASGAITQDMYADADVKKVKDAMYELDRQIGQVARDMEFLARKLKK